MKENIRFAYVTTDGKEHKLNVGGVQNIIDAAFEIASSIMHGDLEDDGKKITADDIVKIIDIPG